jgi:FkbH-like protein
VTAPDVLALLRSGQAADRFPELPALLADLPDADLGRVGQLLARLDPDEVRRAHPTVPALSVAVTGHGTLSALVPPLTAELARHGLLLRPAVSDFDSYVFDLADPGSALYAAAPDLVLCVLDATVVFDDVPVPWRPDDVAAAAAARVSTVEQLAGRFVATGRGTLVLNTIPLPSRYPAQLVDHRSRAQLGAVWREANARLLRLAEQHPAVVVLDLDPLLAEGIPVADDRLDVYAKAHLSPQLLARYAREVGHLARHVTGRTKKCLVLDLDNTVWGGIVGDDGVEGIEVADSYRGEAFRAFQKVAKQIGSQGVLLAAVSKNNPEPVHEALDAHPRMTLRADDFVRVVANWRPKHDNLVELAKTLNLGLDSFVFVDDSPFECGLVRRELPQVTVVQVDEEPALHVAKLLRDGWFDTRELTAEDRARTVMYRQEMERADFLGTFESLDDYLRELGVKVRLGPVTPPEAARVAQITLRTNQFNLTTTRVPLPDLYELTADPTRLVLAIEAADRFGDNGIVGAVFTRRDEDGVHVDNFLLSCRVFSRGIERACLAAVLRHAQGSGAPAVFGYYKASAKNAMVRDFYPRHGFQPADDRDGALVFRHDLSTVEPGPDHLHLTESFERAAS